VSPQDLGIRFFQDGGRRQQLVRNIDAVPVVLDHFENTVDLSESRFQKPGYLVGVSNHRNTL
jgi:hypothetical protein